MQFEKFEHVCVDVSTLTIVFNNGTILTDYDKFNQFHLAETRCK